MTQVLSLSLCVVLCVTPCFTLLLYKQFKWDGVIFDFLTPQW